MEESVLYPQRKFSDILKIEKIKAPEILNLNKMKEVRTPTLRVLVSGYVSKWSLLTHSA